MFGVLYETEEGRFFKTFDTLDDAHKFARKHTFHGYHPVVFDYDEDGDEYLEFYTLN